MCAENAPVISAHLLASLLHRQLGSDFLQHHHKGFCWFSILVWSSQGL